MSIGKKLRFEVFKRDKFTCQYCGQKAPDVVLHCDHIKPVAEGGADTIMNLVTSCQPCNAGKGKRELSDTSVVEKQRRQLEDLQERREQLEMVMEWQRSLLNVQEDAIEHAVAFWTELSGWGLNENGRRIIGKSIKKYGLSDVVEAMTTAKDAYIKYDAGNETIKESVEFAFSKLNGICHMKRVEQDKPYMRQVFYVRGILKNTLNYVNLWESREILERVFEEGGEYEEIKRLAFAASSYTNWRALMWDYLDDLRGDETI